MEIQNMLQLILKCLPMLCFWVLNVCCLFVMGRSIRLMPSIHSRLKKLITFHVILVVGYDCLCCPSFLKSVCLMQHSIIKVNIIIGTAFGSIGKYVILPLLEVINPFIQVKPFEIFYMDLRNPSDLFGKWISRLKQLKTLHIIHDWLLMICWTALQRVWHTGCV